MNFRRVAFSIAIAFCLAAGVVHACSCKGPPSAKESLSAAAAVFVGKVVKTERDVHFGVRVTFEITTVWKGVKERTVDINTGFGGGDCGYPVKVGDKYLVYAFGSRSDDGKLGPLATTICSRTCPVDRAKADIKALGPTKMPPV